VSASAVAMLTSNGPDIAGLSQVKLSGGGTAIARLGTETGTVQVGGNGSWSTSGGSQILGDANYRGSVPTATITGTKTLMAADLVYPAATTPGTLTADFGTVSYSGNYTMPGGTYQADSFAFSSGTITLTGDIDLYVSGTMTVSGSAVFNTNNGAYKLRVYMTSTAQFTHSAGGTNYMSIYAPQSTIRISSGTVVGSAIGNVIDMSGGSKLYYSSSLASTINPTSGGLTVSGTITSVK
jgi:hypothetical protein